MQRLPKLRLFAAKIRRVRNETKTFWRNGTRLFRNWIGHPALGSGVYGEVERRGHNLICQALDIGINFFDTAPLYGNKHEDGGGNRAWKV